MTSPITLNFLSEYYQSRAGDQNGARILNMFLEVENQNVQDSNQTGGVNKQSGKYKITGYPTPGLSLFHQDADAGSVRGLFSKNNVLYSVIDDKFYQYTSAGVRTLIGTLNTTEGIVEISDNSYQIVINDEVNGYLYNLNTSVFGQITDLDYTPAPGSLTSQDEYFLVSEKDTSIIYGSDPATGETWSALSFGSKVGQSDHVVKIISDERRIFVLGENTSEVWVNSGAPTFSFEPDTSVFYHYGCAAKNSAVVCKDSLYFLAKTDKGGVEVMSISGYQPKVLSNFAVTYRINQFSTYSDAQAFCYVQNGHTFYELTFPSEGVTFLYDATSTMWSELKTGTGRHKANCFAYCFGYQLVGDYETGNVYYLDDTVYTDNGTPILREIISSPAYALGLKVRITKLQMDFQNNVGATVPFTVDVSRDSGQTYSFTLNGNIPQAGGRVFWTSLGMTQNAWVIRWRCSADANVIILGATAVAQPGIN